VTSVAVWLQLRQWVSTHTSFFLTNQLSRILIKHSTNY